MAGSAVSSGSVALREGRWADARDAFEAALAVAEDAEARAGLSSALWWLGAVDRALEEAARAYALFRAVGDVVGAVRCAVWSSSVQHGDMANHAAANGWVERAETLVAGLPPRALHGWVLLARAGLGLDLPVAESLTERALLLAREHEDVDLELSALAQLGRLKVSRGQTRTGFALIDEAMAAALAGERTTHDTVANTGCDMLTACELVADLERAEQWCRVVDGFVEQVGCPYLFAECRVVYGGVLVATGRWREAEAQLTKVVRPVGTVAPGLRTRARVRLAGLRVRQGRLEEADELLRSLEAGPDVEPEARLCLAELQLAGGDLAAAGTTLERCLGGLGTHTLHLSAALGMLVQTRTAQGDLDRAGVAERRVTALARSSRSALVAARAADARGLVADAAGACDVAAVELREALSGWTQLGHPFEAARTRARLGAVLVAAGDVRAAELLRRSWCGLRDLGAASEADRVASRMRALGVPVPVVAAGPGALSPRETQVLTLVARGLSNPEIAARLHLSRRTVAHHVSHVLTKLDLRNRTEVATYAASHPGPCGLPRRTAE